MSWEKLENDDLLHAVRKCKDLELPIVNAFRAHGDKYGRSFNSVKRHYYTIAKSFNNVVNIDEYKRPKITEKDLEALFRGLVKLIAEQVQSDKNGT